MTETPVSRYYSEQQAGSLTTGDQLLLPDGERTAEIQQVEVQSDDYGAPAVVLASLSGGGTIRSTGRVVYEVLHAEEPMQIGVEFMRLEPSDRATLAIAVPGPSNNRC